MRNEIYNRIKQNKMKFYAELNNFKEKANPESNTDVKQQDVENPIKVKQKEKKDTFLERIGNRKYKLLFQKVPELVKTGYRETVKSKAMDIIRTQIKNDQDKIRQFSTQINQKIDEQTDKLANGVYHFSSFLFEEQNEKGEIYQVTGDAKVAESQVNNNLEWEVQYNSQPKISLNEEIAIYSERVFRWIKKIPGRIHDYLASDKLPEPNDVHLIARN